MKLFIIPLCLNVVFFVRFICAGGLGLLQISLKGYDNELRSEFVNQHQNIIEQGKTIIEVDEVKMSNYITGLVSASRTKREGRGVAQMVPNIDFKSFKSHKHEYRNIMRAITEKLDEDEEGKAIIRQEKSGGVDATLENKMNEVIEYLRSKGFMPKLDKPKIEGQLKVFEDYDKVEINEFNPFEERVDFMWVEETKRMLKAFDKLVRSKKEYKSAIDAAPMHSDHPLSPSYYLVVLNLSVVLVNVLCPRLQETYSEWIRKYEDWKSRGGSTAFSKLHLEMFLPNL